MTASMAVMGLYLTKSKTIPLLNPAHIAVSVLYLGKAGAIGWVDPERTVSAGTTGIPRQIAPRRRCRRNGADSGLLGHDRLEVFGVGGFPLRRDEKEAP